MSGSCGACTLCCTVMRVAMEPPKPEYETCRFCVGHGCAVYDQRPDPCRGFMCAWLASQKMPGLQMSSALRPDRSGVCIDLNAAGTVIAHCARPASWKRDPMYSVLLRHAARTNVVLELPTGAELLRADGSTDRLVKVGVHESGNRLYALEREQRLAKGAAA